MADSEMGSRQRLPTLFEVLSRRTLAPVDLFSFYIYMRDQQRSVDYLDFWLDVAQHMSLCRHYVRELRRSVLIDTPDLEKTASKRSSQLLDRMDIPDPNADASVSPAMEKAVDERLSAFLRLENGNRHSPSSSLGSDTSQKAPADRQLAESTKQDELTPSPNGRPRPSFMGSNSHDHTDSASPQHTVARADIRASAEKVLYTYLLKGSEREIVLPGPILAEISHAIEVDGRDDPEVFDEAKDYVFQAMERDAFPGFLRAKALGNLVLPSSMLRLILGLIAMFAGFWTAFCLIFLDLPRSTRCWVILPFAVGIYCLCAHQYSLDPILALLGFSEYTFMNLTRIREPYVRKLLNKRAAAELAVAITIIICFSVFFVFIPGRRL